MAIVHDIAEGEYTFNPCFPMQGSVYIVFYIHYQT